MAYFGSRDAAGIVEPVPRLFAEMAEMVDATAKRIEELGASETSFAHLAEAAEALLQHEGLFRTCADN